MWTQNAKILYTPDDLNLHLINTQIISGKTLFRFLLSFLLYSKVQYQRRWEGQRGRSDMIQTLTAKILFPL